MAEGEGSDRFYKGENPEQTGCIFSGALRSRDSFQKGPPRLHTSRLCETNDRGSKLDSRSQPPSEGRGRRENYAVCLTALRAG